MPWHTFALFNAVGAIAWSMTWLMGGYLIGELVHLVIGDLRHVEVWLFAGVATAALAVGAYLHFRNRESVRARRKHP